MRLKDRKLLDTRLQTASALNAATAKNILDTTKSADFIIVDGIKALEASIRAELAKVKEELAATKADVEVLKAKVK
ncbi:MAG: hypothetical protein WC657_08990 [Candidatus Paceibacterota bacterium]|jgi:hypothetical protein